MFHQRLRRLEPREKVRKILESDERYLKDPYSEEAVDAFIWALCGSCRATKGEQSHAIDELCSKIFDEDGHLDYQWAAKSSTPDTFDSSSESPTDLTKVYRPPRFEFDYDDVFWFDNVEKPKPVDLDEYYMPVKIEQAVVEKRYESFDLRSSVNVENYIDLFHEYLFIEEAYQKKFGAKRKFDDAWISYVGWQEKNYKLLSVVVPEGIDKSYRCKDLIIIISSKTEERIICEITGIKEKENRIEFEHSFSNETFLTTSNPFKVEIVPSRYGFQWLHHAVDKLEKNSRIKDIIFPKETSTLSASKVHEDSPNLANSSRCQLNDQQRAAVKSILAAKCRPAPYIVFGPPGTGKTKTIIEAILQIYENSSTAKILVCANSNSCVNLLTLKILESKAVESEDFVRIVSLSNYKKVPSDIKHVTVTSSSVIPRLIYEQYKIIITTCTLAGHLKRFEGLDFGYVFIDEAGQATEPETLLPIDMMHRDGLVVLSGDPYQLGPYYEAKILEKSAFATSLLERLNQTVMMYRRRSEKEARAGDILSYYDERYITKLIISYRSDPRVLAVNNKLFYDDDLVCRNISSSKLMAVINVKHPLVFHHVKGKERQLRKSPSWWNPEELFTCLYYLRRLYRDDLAKPDQIGIISPYSLQNLQFKKWFKLLNIPECKVDTVEAFQGQEREVMIISTVRSVGNNPSKSVVNMRMRFLFQAKRFNVTTSRAKWINIAVGNSELLSMDNCWSEYLERAERLPRDSIPSKINDDSEAVTEKLRKLLGSMKFFKFNLE